MLFRFSLYGFLKNLRFFDSFLVLALLDRGLDYTQIGALVSIREIASIVLEVPAGAIADHFGRRRCMVASMIGYVLFSLLLWRAESFWLLALAMLCYGAGDASRSGTHKAMILAWLRLHDRLGDKTRVYGYTRSWSQLGSACSALAGGALLFGGAGYRAMFLAYAVIAAANAINLAAYPHELDERDAAGNGVGVGGLLRTLFATLRRAAVTAELRTVLATGAVVDGVQKVAKDYLQPVLLALVMTVSFGGAWSERQRVGVVVAVVSALLFVASSIASRQAHRYEQRFGGPERSTLVLLMQMVLALLAIAGCCVVGWPGVASAMFVLLHVGNNLWRPVQVGRVGERGDRSSNATLLSIESQAGALTAALFAPAIGWLVDRLAAGIQPTPLAAMRPLGLLMLPLLLVLFAELRQRRSAS